MDHKIQNQKDKSIPSTPGIDKMNKFIKLKRYLFQLIIQNRLIILILLISFLLRLILFIGISPNCLDDTPSYERGAFSLMKLESPWKSYPRTPVYPLFLAFVYKLTGQKNYKAVVFIQVFLFGLANVLIIYFLGIRLTGQRHISAIAAILYNLEILILQFDFAILTESISGFILLLSILLLLKAINRPLLKWTILSALIIGITPLVRPAFAPILVPLVLFFIISNIITYTRPIKWKKLLLHTCIYIVLSFLPSFVWLTGNKIRGKGFSFSRNLLNAGLMNHARFFFELVPDKYAPIRNPYIIIRNKNPQLAAGSYYRARNEMYKGAKRMGVKSEQEFEKLITHICISLFRKHPNLYMKTFWVSWDEMWKRRRLPYFSSKISPGSDKNFERLEKKFFWGFWFKNIERGILQKKWCKYWQFKVFLITALIIIIQRRKNRDSILIISLILITVLTLAITINALELGENCRYRAPFQSLVLLTCISGTGVLIYWIILSFKSILQKKETVSSPKKRKKKSKMRRESIPKLVEK